MEGLRKIAKNVSHLAVLYFLAESSSANEKGGVTTE
jgi:hypothetical protein